MKLAAAIWTALLVLGCLGWYVLCAAEDFAAGWETSRLERLRRRRAA